MGLVDVINKFFIWASLNLMATLNVSPQLQVDILRGLHVRIPVRINVHAQPQVVIQLLGGWVNQGTINGTVYIYSSGGLLWYVVIKLFEGQQNGAGSLERLVRRVCTIFD